MSKFTNGPWKVGSKGFNACSVFDGDGENAVCQVYGIPLHTKVRDVGERYAEGMANAHLIATAPELYEALEFALARLGSMTTTQFSMGEDAIIRSTIREALAKADGVQS